ncbi:protein kinase, ATP binding site-containing protein [Tanacetum coccineum]
MSFPMVNLENKFIPLKEIELATEEFDRVNKIVLGEYSTLYRGQLSESWENRTAAFKRFTGDRCDGKKEFLNELKFISILNHENIIPFLGYCDEGEEMIMVYEYPLDGRSLLTYLDWHSLTWQQRLEICLDAARGLNYLHSGLGQHGTVMHGSFRDRNILLDDNMKAKICGFEISELIPGNQPCKQVYKPYTNEDLDIRRHKDPIYLETGFLKPESDIYSFGVLLFSILTSTQSFEAVIKTGDCIQNSLTMMVQHYYHYRLDLLINDFLRDQIGGPSFRMIEEITCKCLSYNIKDRPTIDTLIKTIKDALDIHNREAISVKGSLGEYRDPKEFLIPSKELKLGTCKKSSLPPHVYSDLYTAEFYERWPNRTVVLKVYDPKISWRKSHNECEIVSRFHHENIIPYLGYCEEGDRKILIYEDAINGSLRDHLQDQDKLRCIPWEQRLKICLGAARGIKCLHSGHWDENILVIHRHIRSENILLDENMEAKISAFGLSLLLPRNKPQTANHKKWELGDSAIIRGYKASMDPIYKESGIVNSEVDVYSLGVVMFEILSGLKAYERENFDDDDDDDDANNGDDYSEKPNLIKLIKVSQRTHYYSGKPDLIKQVHRHYGENEMDKLIDPNIRDQIDGRSLQIFAETAYRCLSYNIKERPSMNRIIKKIEEALYFQDHKATISTTEIPTHQYQKLEDLRIPLKEIKLATRDFSENYQIGKGAFGVVYKGRLSESWTKHEAAFKRLIKTSDIEKTGFLKELKLISMFHHQNIIRLIGYCDDGDEMILVSEYAINGSLDDHLEDPKKRRLLTWNKRLKICLGAAKGLDYLHSGLGENNKVIHRDVKCGNILLDDTLEAKICDFGLSKTGFTYDHQHSKHYTDLAGTDYYMDPIYNESGILRTDSDVYSFGVVMFEMLSGMPAYYQRKIGDDKSQPLINLVRRYYDYGKDLLIDYQIKDQIDKNSLHTFVEIAYRCISFISKERPTMEMIADKIEEALELQYIEDLERYPRLRANVEVVETAHVLKHAQKRDTKKLNRLRIIRVVVFDHVFQFNLERWFWDLNGDGIFQVKDVRSMLDETFLSKMEVPTRWIKSIPIKVNVFAWKLYLDRLPSRSNLSRRNVSLLSLACPICDHVLEDSSHLFFGCSVAKDIQKLICRWWNLDVHPYKSYEDWLSWFKSIRLGSKTKEIELIGVASDGTRNEVGRVGDTSTVIEGVTPSMIDMTVEKDKLSFVVDTTVLGSFPPLLTPVTTSAGNAPGKSSYANITGKPSGKKVNGHTLFTPGGNEIDVVVPVDSICAISERFANTDYGFFLGKKVAYPVVANYVRNTWVKYGLICSMFSSFTGLFSFQFSSMDGLDDMLENSPWFIRNNPLILKKWHPDENLLKEDISTVPGFKPQKEYRPVTKKHNASSSGNKKKGVEPTIEVSNSNPFDVLNLVDNDGEFGTNRGTNNLVHNEATSSGSSFMNIDNDGQFASNTPIGAKIDKIEQQIGKGKLRLLDNDRNPLVPTGIVESDIEVEVVFDETANLRIPTSGKDGSDKGYGTNSLLEQWRDSYLDNDDYDPYHDDMYENHDLSEHLQSICDDFDITVRGMKKK